MENESVNDERDAARSIDPKRASRAESSRAAAIESTSPANAASTVQTAREFFITPMPDEERAREIIVR